MNASGKDTFKIKNLRLSDRAQGPARAPDKSQYASSLIFQLLYPDTHTPSSPTPAPPGPTFYSLASLLRMTVVSGQIPQKQSLRGELGALIG